MNVMLSRPLRLAAALLLLVVSGPSARAADTLVAAGSAWKYLDNGSNQGTAWRAGAFDDSSWASGPAELGYGDGGEATLVGYGPNSSAKYITTYFRSTFTVANPAAYTGLTLNVVRDDGVVVYLNGAEVYRSNLPTGTIAYTTLATTAIGGADESAWQTAAVSAGGLVAGTNTLAVELHQSGATSSDISFNLSLTGTTGGPSVTRGPYLQVGTPTGVVVRWRTDIATDSRVRYGTSSANLDQLADNASVTTEHEVALSGLSANTTYYYSVGSLTATYSGGTDHRFTTSPAPGTGKPTRIWVLGDSGTADANAAAVRNAYTAYTGATPTDLWLMLGDNAYNTGTDAEYQAAVFNMYPSTLRQSVLWPTIGNHDTASSTNPPANLPYYEMFTLPTAGQAGGRPSGTEDYYSFDYGNIHFICLDSMTTDRSPGGAMATWLADDLANTTEEWVVAFWHHPPYTKGSHDSDAESQLIQMRENLVPILESYGVDLVLTGHSHSYERSYLIDGHYGVSSTFDSSHLVDGGDGRESGTGAYRKPTDGLGAHEGAVYAVAGSSGKISGGLLNHPAMLVSLNNLGSLVLDVNGNRMDVKFLRENGAVTDSFTILKGNQAPSVSLTAPSNGAVYTAPASVALSASASDADGGVAQVEFFANGTSVGVDTSSPYGLTWSNVAQGSYSLTAVATDDLGATATSTAVSITVNAPATPPAAPSGLSASAAGSTQINLTWTDNAGNETGFRIERSTNGTTFGEIATVGANVTSYASTGLTAGTTYWYRVRATNGNGDSGYSNTASATTAAAAPAAPSSLTATAVSKSQINLAWTDNSGNESGFKVYRSTNGTSFTLIATTAANATTYASTGLTGNKTYYYRVRATGLSGDSADSNTASAKTPKR